MARDPLRFARLLRTWCTRGRTPQTQRVDLHKRATPGPDLVDLLADPRLIGTEKR